MEDDAQAAEPLPEPLEPLEPGEVSVHEQEDLVILLGTVPERAADLTAGIDEERLRYRHGPAFQTLQELIEHLAEAGTRVDALLRHAYLDQERELAVRASIDPAPETPSGRPAAELLDAFARVRRRTVDMLRGLTDEDWERRVSDPREGELSLLEITRFVTQHELGHLAQLRNLIAVLPEPLDLGPVGQGPRPAPSATPREEDA
jgi:DinB family protein